MNRFFQGPWGEGKGRLALLAIAAVLALLDAASAEAVTRFGPALLVPQRDRLCQELVVSTGATGVSGFGTCSRVDEYGNTQYDALTYMALTRQGWQIRVLPWMGRPLDVTEDSTGTYLLYHSTDTAFGYGATLLKRDLQGRYTRRHLGPAAYAGSASIVARDGKWWTVSSASGTGHDPDRNFNLWEAGTLLGNRAAHAVSDNAQSDYSPKLVLRPSGGLVLLWVRGTDLGDHEDDELRVGTNLGAGWNSRTVKTETNSSVVDAATDGHSVFVFYVQAGRPVIASDESGILRAHRFITRSCVQYGALTASAGVVTSMFTQCGETGHAVVALERRSGSWTTSTLYPDSTSTSQPGVLDLVSRRGHSTVLLRSGFQTFTRSQH